MTYVLSKFAATIVGCGSRRMVQADGAEKYCGINTIAWTVHGVNVKRSIEPSL